MIDGARDHGSPQEPTDERARITSLTAAAARLTRPGAGAPDSDVERDATPGDARKRIVTFLALLLLFTVVSASLACEIGGAPAI